MANGTGKGDIAPSRIPIAHNEGLCFQVANGFVRVKRASRPVPHYRAAIPTTRPTTAPYAT